MEATTPPNIEIKHLTVEEKINNPVLLAIATCEGKTQYHPDGSLVRGIVNHHDIGLFQINEKYHLNESKKLGLNIYTLGGNIAYAKILYNLRGTSDWNASRGCWLPKIRLSNSGRSG